jgi:hypothetical protein
MSMVRHKGLGVGHVVQRKPIYQTTDQQDEAADKPRSNELKEARTGATAVQAI